MLCYAVLCYEGRFPWARPSDRLAVGLAGWLGCVGFSVGRGRQPWRLSTWHLAPAPPSYRAPRLHHLHLLHLHLLVHICGPPAQSGPFSHLCQPNHRLPCCSLRAHPTSLHAFAPPLAAHPRPSSPAPRPHWVLLALHCAVSASIPSALSNQSLLLRDYLGQLLH